MPLGRCEFDPCKVTALATETRLLEAHAMGMDMLALVSIQQTQINESDYRLLRMEADLHLSRQNRRDCVCLEIQCRQRCASRGAEACMSLKDERELFATSLDFVRGRSGRH